MLEPIAEESTDSAPVPTVPHRTFGHRAAKGFASTLASTLIVKGVSFVGQVVIAAHLTKHEMGLAATALAASTFPAQIKEFGIQQLMLRHPRRYEEWSVDALWLSTVLGVIAAVATAVSVPLVARVTNSPGVVGPLLLLGLQNLIVGPTLVPYAKFSIDLRFILVARLNTALTIISTSVSIGLALRGFGPYALVLPLLLGTIIRSVTTFWLVPIRLTRWPAWSRWRVMLGDGWRMSLSLMFFQVVWQCDYLILGMRRSQEQVGIYFFAFQLSSQMLTLMSQNLAGVLLPVLGHMAGDAGRQMLSFVRAAQYLCAVSIPLCFVQAAVADPLVRLIWHEKWIDAIPALRALSIGTAFRLLGVPATSLMIAQGRLNAYLISAASSAVGFVLVVSISTYFGAATLVAIVVAVFYSVMETGIAVVALGGCGPATQVVRRGISAVQSVLTVPLLCGLCGGAAGYAAVILTSRAGLLVSLCAGTVAGLLVSIGALRMISLRLFAEIAVLPRLVMARVVKP